MKIAVCQVADTGPLESLAVMLREAGYQCLIPDEDLRRRLLDLGCDTVISIRNMIENWGYQTPDPDLVVLPSKDPVTKNLLDYADLYVDVKAHRNGPKIWRTWPRLRNRTLWYRINGCAPEHVIRDGVDFGDESNPPCPILTPNQWYSDPGPWSDRAYVCWPPFHRIEDYNRPRNPIDRAICLLHNAAGWGYGKLFGEVQKLGVRIYGLGSPDGLIANSVMPETLSRALCMVHLKSSDAPGYALYEALAARCPVVIPRRLIWRSKMEALFKPGENCYVFDRPTHDSLSTEDVQECAKEIRQAILSLSSPAENRRIGEAGYNSLRQLLWGAPQDRESFQQFMRTHFGA